LEQLKQRNAAPPSARKQSSQHLLFAQDILNLMKVNTNGVKTKSNMILFLDCLLFWKKKKKKLFSRKYVVH
jgi:hypothetical protein